MSIELSYHTFSLSELARLALDAGDDKAAHEFVQRLSDMNFEDCEFFTTKELSELIDEAHEEGRDDGYEIATRKLAAFLEKLEDEGV